MPRGGRRSTSFRPGQSGNYHGRPKRPFGMGTVEADVKALAREAAPEAITTLKKIMLDERAPHAVRIAAGNALLDRGYGRPAQSDRPNGQAGGISIGSLMSNCLNWSRS